MKGSRHGLIDYLSTYRGGGMKKCISRCVLSPGRDLNPGPPDMINEILKGQNIIEFIKKQRLNWLGHVERMAEDNIVQKIKRWKPMSRRPIGRHKTRWEDDVLEDIKSINIRNWKKVVQNRDSWKKVVEQARTLYRL